MKKVSLKCLSDCRYDFHVITLVYSHPAESRVAISVPTSIPSNASQPPRKLERYPRHAKPASTLFQLPCALSHCSLTHSHAHSLSVSQSFASVGRVDLLVPLSSCWSDYGCCRNALTLLPSTSINNPNLHFLQLSSPSRNRNLLSTTRALRRGHPLARDTTHNTYHHGRRLILQPVIPFATRRTALDSLHSSQPCRAYASATLTTETSPTTV